MRHLKTINELFDDPIIKSQMEIPYLQGSIPCKELIKDKNIIPGGDNLLGKISMNCPYIGHLNYKRISNNLLNIGFQENLNFGEGNDVVIYFVIEIMEHASSQRYLCNSYAKCIGNGKTLYDEKINRSIMPYDKLVDVMNGEVLNLLVDFTKFTDHTFKFKGFPYKDRNYMTGLNLGRN